MKEREVSSLMQASTNTAQSAWGEWSSSKTTASSRGVQKLWAGKGKQGILLNSLLYNVEPELLKNLLHAKKPSPQHYRGSWLELK